MVPSTVAITFLSEIVMLVILFIIALSASSLVLTLCASNQRVNASNTDSIFEKIIRFADAFVSTGLKIKTCCFIALFASCRIIAINTAKDASRTRA